MSREKASRDQITLSQRIAVGLAIVVALVGFWGVSRPGFGLHPFDFRFNAYALFSLASVITNVVVLILVGRIKAKSDDLVWFSFHVACLGMWALVEFFTRISATASTFLFWWPLSSPPAFFMSVALFMFALSYTNPRQAKHVWTIIPLLITGFLMIFFDLRTPLFNHYEVAKVVATPWSGAIETGTYYDLTTLWVIGIYVLALGLFIRFYRRTLDPRQKKQTRLFIIATLIPVTVGAITDGVLPALGVFNVLPLAVMLTAVTGGIIAYGILRYRFLSLSPALVANNILETISEAVIGMTSDFHINYINKGAEYMLGYGARQFERLRFTDFLTQEWDTDILRQALFEPLEDATHSKFDSVDLRTASGTMVTAKLSVSKLSQDDQMEGYLVVMTDITELARAKDTIEREVSERTREVQETKATLVTSINSLKLGFIVINAEPEVIRVNTVAHDLLCQHSNSHTAGDCREVTLVDVRRQTGLGAKLTHTIQQCFKRQLPQELHGVSFSGRDWRVSLSPMVVDRESIGCVVLLQDITAEQMLERSRDEFFSIASHELRTPLTSIKGNSSMIMEYYPKILKDKTLNEMVTDIHESSDRLIQIVNDFLDVSRLEQGRIEYHMDELPLAALIGEVCYDMKTLVAQRGIKLVLGEGLGVKDKLPLVLADKNRLKQILFNLLGNATKFTEKGSITVEVVIVNGRIKVHVADTGSGIAETSQRLLFHKFQQAAESILTRDTTHGTGLGLYISRLLAEGMGGELELTKSVLGKGSVFTLTLMVATPERLKQAQLQTKVLDLKSGLIVDKK